MNSFAELIANKVMYEAPKNDQRAGQYLFNTLAPREAQEVVRGTTFDPFYTTNMSKGEVIAWIHEHLVFNDGGRVIAVFNRNHILWEAESDDT